jgi:hypothetical protein
MDPFLSSKIFNSAIYQNSNDIEKDLNIDTRINHEIYGNVDYNPVYFQGENTHSALNSFVSSEAFNTFKKALSNIEQHLKNWLKLHPMQIKISYWRNGEKLWSESPADRVIGIFFSRLAGEYYSDARIQLYADGKKNRNFSCINTLQRDLYRYVSGNIT